MMEIAPIWSEKNKEYIFEITTIESIFSKKEYAKELECYWCKKEYPPVPDLDLIICDFLNNTELAKDGHRFGPIPNLIGIQVLLDWTMKNSECYTWIPDYGKPLWIARTTIE